MSVSHARLGSGFVTSLIHENLGSVLAPDRCSAVLEEALVHAGLFSVPSRGAELKEFLERHLIGTLSTTVSPSEARAVVDQIVSVLPAQLLADAEAAPAAPLHKRDPHRSTSRAMDNLEVVVVTPSDATFSRIARRFAPTAMLARYHRLESMNSTFVDPVVLLDARNMLPGTDPHHQVAGRDVLLWGADRWSPQQIEWVLSLARSVTPCPSEVEAEELSVICRALRMENSSHTARG